MAKKDIPRYASLVRADDQATMPWKNGGGSTREIAISPPGASLSSLDFLWRLSAAEVASPGPFSSFPGYDRVLMVTNAAELRLAFEASGKVVTLGRGQLHRFPGEDALRSEIPKGTVHDLGIIHKRGKLRAELHYLPFAGKPRSFQLTAETVFFVVLAGKVAASTYPGELKFRMGEGDALRVDRLPAERAREERLVLLEPAAPDTIIAGVEIYDRT